MRIGTRAFFGRNLPWAQIPTWAEALSGLVELRRGRTIFIDNVSKFLNVYTVTYHYHNDSSGTFAPSSLSVFGPL